MAEPGERNAQEREAARHERARNRAARAQLDHEHELDGHDEEPFALAAEDELEQDEEDYEVPSGTRRAPREPRRVARTRHSWAGRALALLALIAGVALIWFLVELFQPLHGSAHGSVTVTIPARTSASEIGNMLERDGVISSGFFFTLRATLDGDRGKLLSGTYRMKLGMTYGGVLKLLTTPPPAAKVTEVTIVPGETRRQVDARLRAQGVAGSYAAATRHSTILDPADYRAPRDTPSLEGFLFPDTYQLREPISIAALVTDQLQTFRQQFATVNLGYARARHLTPYDVLIIASLVEAETQVARERPLVASVIYNRLARGMPLQIDSTTRYLTGNYTSPLTKAQLSSPSPYNTRIHKGLPPTPIDSPGLASIQAAAHPARTSYLYYVVKVCGDGSADVRVQLSTVQIRRCAVRRGAVQARRALAGVLLRGP